MHFVCTSYLKWSLIAHLLFSRKIVYEQEKNNALSTAEVII